MIIFRAFIKTSTCRSSFLNSLTMLFMSRSSRRGMLFTYFSVEVKKNQYLNIFMSPNNVLRCVINYYLYEPFLVSEHSIFCQFLPDCKSPLTGHTHTSNKWWSTLKVKVMRSFVWKAGVYLVLQEKIRQMSNENLFKIPTKKF